MHNRARIRDVLRNKFMRFSSGQFVYCTCYEGTSIKSRVQDTQNCKLFMNY